MSNIGKVKNEHYVTIQGWMINELNLKGNELLVYAIIYGFSQTENQTFTGSLQYLADWCSATKQGILKNLKSLVDKGLIVKDEVTINGVKFCEYSCIPLNSVEYPIKHSLINNIDNNIVNNNTITINSNSTDFDFGTKKSQTKKSSLFDKCVSAIDDFTEDNVLRELLIASLKLFLENSREAGTPFYTNHFKGKLNNLKKLSEDSYEQRKIVQQTLDNGWNGFYAIKDNRNKKEASTDIGYTSTRAKKGGKRSESKF